MKECPTCHRPFGSRGRTCFACELPIRRNHRWKTVGCYNQHCDCANPTMTRLFDPAENVPAPALLTANEAEELAGTETSDAPEA